MTGSLAPLQIRILRELSRFQPRWRLTGGAALIGAYAHHRTTWDLDLEGIELQVDSPHELLVNKLCALLGRSELRDLEDVQELLAMGQTLGAALRDAPGKDAGFSPLTLTWVLRELDVGRLAELEGWSSDRARNLESARGRLVEALLEEINGGEE